MGAGAGEIETKRRDRDMDALCSYVSGYLQVMN